jgi:hypothetical protein
VDVFLLLGLLALLRASAAPNPTRPACIAGLLLACAVLTMQDQGGYALLGTCALALPLFSRDKRARTFGGFLAGFSVGALPLLIYLVSKVGVARLWEEWVLFPLTGYHGAAGNRVSIAEGFRQILGQWDPVALRVAPVYTTLIALDSMVVYALPLLAALGWALAWKRRWLPSAQLALLAVFGASFLGAAFHRWSLMNLIWAAPLLAVMAALPLDRALAAASPVGRRAAVLLSFVLLASFCGFGVLRIWAARPARTHAVVTQAGTYRTFNPHDARALQEFCDAVLERVPAGEGAFCIGFNPLLNFLVGHPNPTRFNFLLAPGYNSPAHLEEWARSLDAGRVLWGFGPNAPPAPGDATSAALAKGYRPVWANRAFILWARLNCPEDHSNSPIETGGKH